MRQRLGEGPAAAEALRESLSLFRDLRRKWESVNAVERLAALVPDPARAARLLGAAEAVRDALGAPIAPLDQAEHTRLVERLRADLSAPDFQQAWAAGRGQGAADWDQVVAAILSPG